MSGLNDWQSPTSGQQYGWGTHVVGARDGMDARRMGGRTPEAEYPDGYLGTIQSRREDRVLNSLKARLGDKQYQRGVHKGERIDPGDYEWPADYTPDRGLQLQQMGVRQAPLGSVTEQLVYGNTLPDNAKHLVPQRPELVDPHRQSVLARYSPTWR